MTAIAGPIVIADDYAEGRLLTMRFLRKMSVENPTIELADGNEVITYLERVDTGDAEFPVLLILDENMPGHTGREILRWRHERPTVRSIPTIMLTGEAISSDIDVMLDTLFMMKPISFDEFAEAVRDLGVA